MKSLHSPLVLAGRLRSVSLMFGWRRRAWCSGAGGRQGTDGDMLRHMKGCIINIYFSLSHTLSYLHVLFFFLCWWVLKISTMLFKFVLFYLGRTCSTGVLLWTLIFFFFFFPVHSSFGSKQCSYSLSAYQQVKWFINLHIFIYSLLLNLKHLNINFIHFQTLKCLHPESNFTS